MSVAIPRRATTGHERRLCPFQNCIFHLRFGLLSDWHCRSSRCSRVRKTEESEASPKTSNILMIASRSIHLMALPRRERFRE